jgi:hypothetical protein
MTQVKEHAAALDCEDEELALQCALDGRYRNDFAHEDDAEYALELLLG